MKPPRVVNYREEKNKQGLLYIGRAMPSYGLQASPWANPHKITKDTPENRQQALDLYRADILKRPNLSQDLQSLAGQTLACWCSPKPCHGDVLVQLFRDIVLRWPEEGDPRTKLHFHLCIRGPWTDAQGLDDLHERGLLPRAVTRWNEVDQDLATRALRYYCDLLR
jgi:hypothetical protein